MDKSRSDHSLPTAKPKPGHTMLRSYWDRLSREYRALLMELHTMRIIEQEDG